MKTIPLRVAELRLQLELVGAEIVKTDGPANDTGAWFVDFKYGNVYDCIQWDPKHGFGVWRGAVANAGFGENPTQFFRSALEAAHMWGEWRQCA